MTRALVVGCVVLAGLSFAQTAAVTTTDPSRGVTLLPASAAFGDDATSAVFNPAALTHAGTFSAIFEHERSNSRALDSDALFLGSSLADFLGAGVTFESLRPNDGAPQRARTSLGFALGAQALSAGANVNWLFGGPTDGLVSVDVGLQSRPLRCLSLGATLRNLNAPQKNGAGLSREYDVGVGLRPFHEHLTLGVDWLAAEGTPLEQSRLQYSAQWQVIHGVRLLAGASHGFSSAVPLALQAGVGLDLEHFGYTQGATYAAGQLNWQFVARYSADATPSIVPRHSIAVLSLADIATAPQSTVGSLLGLNQEDRYLRFLNFLERAAHDPTLEGVVLKIEGAGVGMARADEVRTALLKLRAAGKRVYGYVFQVSDAEYLIASACDALYAAPDASLMVDGLRSSTLFLGGAAESLGITVDVARVGAYKNFPDQFTRTSMSAEQKEALTAYLDTTERVVAQRVTAGRQLSADQWRAIVNEGLKPVARGKALRQIDEVLTPAAFDEAVKAALPGARAMRRYSPDADRDLRWGARDEIAVIPVLGSISGGRDANAPLAGEISGAESFIAALNSAAEDSDVKAIVIRVDSGGGDAMASDLMYRAVLEAKKRKPVIASMGDVAASGGYYVAMGAQQIFASPTTLTGSIGIFFIKPGVKKLANAVGIAQESVTRGALTGLFDAFDPWSDDERAAAQKWVDAGYDLFITEAASSRHMSKEAIDAVGRGRVWSGEDAKARGLVDSLGGLTDAIEAAKRAAQVDSDDVQVRLWQADASTLSRLVGVAVPSVVADLPLGVKLPAPLMHLANQLSAHAWLLQNPGLQARLEFDVHLQ